MEMLATETPAIFVGQGVTIRVGSDAYAATITEVVNSKTLIVQHDKSTLKGGSWASESQVYDFDRDPDGALETYTLRADGSWKPKGASTGGLIIGKRRTYRDPSF